MNRGFSLLELLVSLAMVAGIALVLIGVSRAGQTSWEVGSAHLTVSHELRRGVDVMSQELTETNETQLDLPADGEWYDSITFRVPADVDGDGTVLDASGNLEWSDTVTYALGGNTADQIQRTQGAAVRVLANGATNLQFRRQVATPTVIELSMTVRRSAGSGDFPNEGTLGTRIQLRN